MSFTYNCGLSYQSWLFVSCEAYTDVLCKVFFYAKVAMMTLHLYFSVYSNFSRTRPNGKASTIKQTFSILRANAKELFIVYVYFSNVVADVIQ